MKRLLLLVLASTLQAVKIHTDQRISIFADSKALVSLNPLDSSSYANVDEVITQNIALDISVDMEKKLVSGNVILKMKALKNTKQVILDTQALEIQSVELIKGDKFEVLKTNVSAPFPAMGQMLDITLPSEAKQDSEFELKVTYKSTAESKVFNWVAKEQTNGKQKGMMFTQCQPIACRGLAPMQDTPVYKTTYNAHVAVDQGYAVKMSAIGGEHDMGVDENGRPMFSFAQNMQVTTYMIAIVVGDLETKKVGDRVNVITEPGMIDEVSNQLMDLGSYLDKTEKYLTPYVWGDYNILILPTAMPNNIAGMENPLLTIAAPEMVTGATVTVTLHEMIHSWFGNLLTCKSWEDFWLNESFTVFTERKMTQKMFGKTAAKMEAFSGNAYLQNDLQKFGADSPFLTLKMKFENGTNPALASSNVQYEKGYQFLTVLEDKVGEANFQKMLRQYIEEYKYKSVTTEDFLSFFKNFVNTEMKDQAKTIIEGTDFQKWVYEAGELPKKFDDSLVSDLEAVQLNSIVRV